jgi:short-subunit dehydrogenase
MNFKEKYGKWALITGGSSGIGKEIAKEIAKKGLNIILVARGKEELDKTQSELTSSYSITVKTIAADLSTEEGIAKIKNESDIYSVGLFVAAAGMEVNGAFEKNNVDKEVMALQINIIALMKLTHHFVNKMTPNKKGGLLFVASLSGHMPNPYFANYAGSKSYVLNFGASLYGELKPKGIDVTVLSPGLTNTPMVKDNGVNWSKTPMKAMDANEVASIGVNALGKKLMAIPGAKNKIMEAIAKHSPLQMQANRNEKMMRKAIDLNKI